jgi:DNA-binding MarR family transcriptional regulator
MATKDELLKALQRTTRSCPLKAGDLSGLLKAVPGSLSVQLHRLSKEGFVAKKGQRSGWFITKKGRKRLQMLAQPVELSDRSREQSFKRKYAAQLEDEIRRSEGTDYGKFLEYGKLAEVPPGFVLLTAEYVWNLGDYRDLTWVWHALGDMRIRRDLRKPWFYGWRAHLGKPIPKELVDEIERA